jgi:hypothetical protein
MTSSTAAPTTTTTEVAPTTTTSTVPRRWTRADLEAAAVDAIEGAGTMLIHDGSVSRYRDAFRGFPSSTSPQYEEVRRSPVAQTYLALAPLPETRLQEGAVWLASFPGATGAERFISEVTTAFREAADPVVLPTSEFDVLGIDGAQGFLVRWLTGRGGPSSSPNAIVWFSVGNVVAAVDINFGGDFAASQWPIDYAIHLARWVHASLSPQTIGPWISGPAAPTATPPSEFELDAVAQFEEFLRAVVSGDMKAARSMAADLERHLPGCGEGCMSDKYLLEVRAPRFSAMLDRVGATVEWVGCSPTSTERRQGGPRFGGQGVHVTCLLRIVDDPRLGDLGISNLLATDGWVVPGQPILDLSSIPEYPG